MAAVADRLLRELVLKNLTTHEHSAALEPLFREAASKVAAAAADCGVGWRQRMAAAEGGGGAKADTKPKKGAAAADAAEAVVAYFFASRKTSKQRTPRPRRPVLVLGVFFCAAV